MDIKLMTACSVLAVVILLVEWHAIQWYYEKDKWWNKPPPVTVKRVLMRGTYIGQYEGKAAYAGQGVMGFDSEGALVEFKFLTDDEFVKLEKELNYDDGKSAALLSTIQATKGYGKYNP